VPKVQDPEQTESYAPDRVRTLDRAQALGLKEYLREQYEKQVHQQKRAWIDLVGAVAAHAGGMRDALRLLDDMYGAAQPGDRDGVGARLTDTVDDWLEAGQDGVCDFLLSELDADRVSSHLIRLLLTITAGARDRLPAWGPCLDRCQASLASRLGSDSAGRLLAPLRARNP
jgi:hypothetical protein